jgi:hypothetical protein
MLSNIFSVDGLKPVTELFEWNLKTQIILLATLPFALIWLYTTINCYMTINSTAEGVKPPVYPFAIPFLGHTIPFVIDTDGFLKKIRNRFGNEPMQLNIGNAKWTYVPHGPQAQKLFKNAKDLGSQDISVQGMRHIFDMPESDVQLLQQDGSGIGKDPAPGFEHIPSHQRFFQQIYLASKDLLQGAELNAMTDLFLAKYTAQLTQDDRIGTDEWTEIPDFYLYLRDILFRSSAEALCGEGLFEAVPNFCEDFWAFDVALHSIFKGIPRWLNPKAWACRDKAVQNVGKWLQWADERFDWSNEEQVNASWEPIYGARVMRKRQQIFRNCGQSKRGDWSNDLGMIWA